MAEEPTDLPRETAVAWAEEKTEKARDLAFLTLEKCNKNDAIALSVLSLLASHYPLLFPEKNRDVTIENHVAGTKKCKPEAFAEARKVIESLVAERGWNSRYDVLLAMLYLCERGKCGGKFDADAVTNMLTRAVCAGDALATLFVAGYGGVTGEEKEKITIAAAERGSGMAMVNIVVASGWGCYTDSTDWQDLFIRAVELGFNFVPYCDTNEFEFYVEAVENVLLKPYEEYCAEGLRRGNLLAMVNASMQFRVPSKLDRAFALLEPAAARGCVQAIYWLGYCQSSVDNQVRTVEYYRKAADLGFKGAYSILSYGYYVGNHGPKDVREARRLGLLGSISYDDPLETPHATGTHYSVP